MNTIIHAMFESLWFAGIVGAVGFVILLFAGRGMEPRQRGKFWLGWMLGTVGLFVLSSAVVTERETLRSDLDGLARSVVDKNTSRLSDYLAAEFSADGMGRDAFLDYAARRLKTVTVDMPWFTRCDMTIDGTTAAMELTAISGVRVDGFSGQAKSEWTLHWRRGLDGWRVTGITPRMLNMQPVRSFDDLRP